MIIIDLSLELDNECMTCAMPWHENVRIKELGKLDEVGRNTSSILMGSHSGTHMDAPRHFFNEKPGIEQADLNLCCGKASVIDFSHKRKGEKVMLGDLKNIVVQKRMIFRFLWYKYWKTEQYYNDFPCFDREAVEYLIKNGMQVMALDTPSPDSAGNIRDKGDKDSPNHKLLLDAGVIIIEYLTNTEQLLVEEEYIFMALPLKIKNSDGAPARVIAIKQS